MKGKKGVSEGIVNFFIYLGFVLLFMVFFYLYKQSSMGVTMASDIGYAEAQATLDIFLITPVKVYGETMPLSELISRASLNESYRRIVRSEIRKIVAPSEADPLFGSITRYEMMVESPAGKGIDPLLAVMQYTEDYWHGDKRTHNKSYYVGKYDPQVISFSEVSTSSGGRLKVGEALIPDRKGELINITLWRSYDPSRNDKDAVNKGAFTYNDLMTQGIYPGEMIEDDNGNTMVFWDIDGRVMISIDGAPCLTKYTYDSEDKVTCLDGSIPDEDDLLSLEDYLDRDPFPIRPASTGGTGSLSGMVDDHGYPANHRLSLAPGNPLCIEETPDVNLEETISPLNKPMRETAKHG